MTDEEVEGMQHIIGVYAGWVAIFTPAAKEKARRAAAENRNRKLYVGNLDVSVTDDDLKALFLVAGVCERANVKIDPGTGRSRGFAFVVMASPEEAQKAIQKLDGRALNGRNLRISAPEERENGKGGRGGWYRR